MGYVAPGASSVAVHALKRATSSDWEHVHNVSSAQARTRFPPLLWRYEMHESPPFRMAFTPLNQAVHSWYRGRCANMTNEEARRRGAALPMSARVSNPGSWPGFGCHSSRLDDEPHYDS